MLGDFLTRILLLIFGYAYPAFECFKCVEKNKINVEELRFWCQYWIIVALITVCERFGDTFLSWLPFYGEGKLGFFIYLWYPTTKGTIHVYGTLLRPYLAKYEPDIDRKIQELKARAWDHAICYWQNCTQLGSTKFFQMLQFMVSNSGKFANTTARVVPNANGYDPGAFAATAENETQSMKSKGGKWPPKTSSPPRSPRSTINRRPAPTQNEK